MQKFTDLINGKRLQKIKMTNVKILQEIENPLFKRKEIKIIIDSVSTPTIEDSKKLVSEKFSKPIEAIAIKSVKCKFGRKTFKIEANVYNSAKDKDKTDPKQKVKNEKVQTQ